MPKKYAFVLLTLLFAPAAGEAQQRDLSLLRDSLAQNSDVAGLRQREQSLRRSREADLLMERGLLLLRLFALTKENRDGDAARSAFEQAIERAPSSGWAHYGLGLALAGGPGVRVPSPGGVLDGFVLGQSVAELIKRDPRSRASRAFIKALELDPTLVAAAIEFANLALISRNQDALKRSRVELQKAVEAGRGDDQVTVALSRVQSALGDLAGAEETTSALPAGSSADALRARAEALLRQPDKADAGAAVYFEGIAKLDEAAGSAFFEDVRIIANEQELASWERGGLEERRAWLEKFWELRAAMSGRTVAERLSEHYRRLAEAQQRYRREGKRGAPPGGSAVVQSSYDPDQLPFDERGLIYVRHGEPANVIRSSDVDVRANESWVYTLPNGKTQLYHFVVMRDGTDYRLVDDLFSAIDPSTQGLPIDGMIKLLEARGAYDQRYNLLANRVESIRFNSAAAARLIDAGGSAAMAGGYSEGARSALSYIGEVRQRLAVENLEAARAALATDSDRPHFENQLPFYYDVFSFKGTDQQTDLTAAFAIPGKSVTPEMLGESFTYSLRVSLVVVDTLSGAVFRKDSLYRTISPRRLTEGEHMRLHVDLSALATRSAVHRVVVHDLNAPGTGQMYGGETAVPEYTSAAIRISDIVLAEPGAGNWHRADAHLGLVPPRQFIEAQPLTVFYELYNLRPDTPYRTEITLAPTAGVTGFARLKKLFGGSDGTVRLEFDGTARPSSNGYVQEIRRVSTELKPGRYSVKVKVTDLTTQQTTTGEKLFVVLDRKK